MLKILDSSLLEQGIREWCIKDTMQAWAEDESLFDSLEEADNSALELSNIEYWYQLDSSIADFKAELGNVIDAYEKRYNTIINSFALIGGRVSHYGAIGGNGRVVGRSGESFSDLLYGDGVEISITDERTIEVRTYDHDGTNVFDLYLVTEAEAEKAEADGYYNHEYLYHKDKNPLKLSKAQVASF